MERKQTVFITGGVGYIGGPTAYALSQKKYRVTVFDRRMPLKHLWHDQPIFFIKGDVRNKTDVRSALQISQPDIVIHLTALTSASESEKYKDLYVDTNVIGTRNVLDAMKRIKCTKIIFASSASVYGSMNNRLSERVPLKPMNVYAQTKKEGEQSIQKEKEMQWIILRYSNVVGSTRDGLFGETIYKNKKLIPSAIRVAIGGQKKLAIYGRDYETPDKTAIRDYVSLEDVVRANMKAVHYLQVNNSSIICNIGSGIGISNSEVILDVEKQLGKKIPLLFKKQRNEPVISVAKIERAKRMLGWEPYYSNISDIIGGLVSFQKIPRRF